MKRNFAIIVVIILVMIVIGVALYMLSKPSSFFSNTPKTNVQRELAVKQNNTPIQEDFPDADYEANGKWYGLCKKHSIHSIDDFRKTVSSDPVLKTHFADFNWDNAQMGKLEKSIRAYVDYRKNDTIFRKKTPIVLPAGDEYITDGNVTVRTNCCNSYYTTPMNELDAEPAAGPSQLTVTPNNPFSPESIQIQTLPPPGQVTPLTTAGGNSGNPAIPLPPPVSPPPGYDPPNSSPPNPTPVPATAWIFGTGLVILIGLRRKYKK